MNLRTPYPQKCCLLRLGYLKKFFLFLKRLTKFLKMFPFFVLLARGGPDNARLRRYGVLDESHSGTHASKL